MFIPVDPKSQLQGCVVLFIGRAIIYSIQVLSKTVYLTIILRARVGYEMIDSQRGA